MLLYDLAYAAAAPFALPLLIRKSLRTGKYRSDLPARFGWGPELPPRPPQSRLLLLHCVSVGELNSVQTLIRRLLAADENLHIALTTTTDTGTARAKVLFPAAAHPRIHTARFPFDFSFAVENLFDRLRPDAIALVELETWPNFLSIARSRRIPVALINGRISEKSFPRYCLIRPLMKNMLRKINAITAQTPAIADRFRKLGANPETLSILPTLKYDNAAIANSVPGAEPLAHAIGLLPEHPLFACGSTGPGEEKILLDAYQSLSPHFPNLRLAIAPRHPEVVPQVIAAIQFRGLTPILRTHRPDAETQNANLRTQNESATGAPLLAPSQRGARAVEPAHEIKNQKSKTENPPLSPQHSALGASEVFLLDTLGELRKLYSLAFAVFAGRSFFKKGGGGSDMIEIAALAKPCCFGEFTHNFAEVVDLLLSHHAAARTDSADSLTQTLANWLKDSAAAGEIGRRAQNLIRAQQGSVDQYVRRLLALVSATRQDKNV